MWTSNKMDYSVSAGGSYFATGYDCPTGLGDPPPSALDAQLLTHSQYSNYLTSGTCVISEQTGDEQENRSKNWTVAE